jgi:hypothetical protein
MQPLLPLLSPAGEEKESSGGAATTSPEKEQKAEAQTENGTDSESREDLKPSHLTPSSESAMAQSAPSPKAFEVTEDDLRRCSETFFFLRDHPELFYDLARCCDSLSVRSSLPPSLLISLPVTRSSWS